MIRWDWYQATIDRVDDGRVPDSLATILGASQEPGMSRLGYSRCIELKRDGHKLASVYGGSARAGEVHVITSAEACDEVVPALRGLWLHRVSRADSAHDAVADWDEVDALVLDFAERKGLAYQLVTNSAGGATRYLGSRKSEVRVRIYRKTEQLRALHGDGVDVPEGLIRSEVQVRPGKRAAKTELAWASPEDAWGFSKWSAELASELLCMGVERTSTHSWRPSEWERTSRHLGKQYGALIRARAAEVGREVLLEDLAELFGV